jgi:hypothetical protein
MGLSSIQESPTSAYCPISLTSTPDALKPITARRQETLLKALRESGITAYDPNSAPFSPDRDLTTAPDFVYRTDVGKIAGSRFFIGHDLLPSTGFGVEEQVAHTLNRVAIILHDAHIRTSRMQPSRAIHLQYENFEQQVEEFVRVFEFLKSFEPGAGFDNGVPALLGFDSQSKAINLEAAVYSRSPNLRYCFNGETPIVKFIPVNAEIFTEKVS